MILSKSNTLINSACKFLDLNTQNLYEVDNFISSVSEEEFINKGHWLSLAQHLNSVYPFEIKQIFFLENNPFLIFAITDSPDEKIHEIYNEIWNLAQPKFLFLESNGRLDVFNLTQPPVKARDELRPYKTVLQIKDILKVLNTFNRESIETGKIWGDNQFSSQNNSADNSLINDLKIVRSKFFESGLNNGNLKYAHALIGRAIFIRYLEDRKIIKSDYFQKVASKRKEWVMILNKELDEIFYKENMGKLLFPRILSNHEFTYTFFRQLAEDFNGDIFPADKEEENIVTQAHLTLLQNLLVGNIEEQKKLFLWAYNFEIIPLELISNIYEEFYHFENKVDPKTKQLKDSKGTHYTPISLVDFVLRKALPFEVLKQHPRVIDPACGSGIFLVEAFRRMVRTELYLKKKQWLSWDELLIILEKQIFGIELNEDAIKISAFSLYLAFLNYQKPPDIEAKIKENKKLPMLLCTDNKQEEKLYFDSLLHANSFDDINNLFADDKVKKNFRNNSFDVVVGNPPWGSPNTKDIEGRKALKVMTDWCSINKKTIFRKEASQAFLWRSIDLLKTNGNATLLVSSGVLFNQAELANQFKKELLKKITLDEVINFINVRKVFFKGGSSPFLALHFTKEEPKNDYYIKYWSINKTRTINNTCFIVSDYNDFKTINYKALNENAWKILWLGNLFDLNFIKILSYNERLQKIIDVENSGRGFQKGNEKNPAGWLLKYSEFPTNLLFKSKYGSLIIHEKALVPVPEKVEHRGREVLFKGNRILIKRGITERENLPPKGQIMARLVKEKFAFRNSVHCIKLFKDDLISHLLILGIVWSSLIRYYLFMTASSWHWHDEIRINEIFNIPIYPKSNQNSVSKIAKIVEKLRSGGFKHHGNEIPNLFLEKNKSSNSLKKLEFQLDEAVFDLYMLTESQRDLIRDRCRYDIDHFYKGTESIAVKPVELPEPLNATLKFFPNNKTEIEEYIDLFLEGWKNYMEDDEEFYWDYFLSTDKEMLAVLFSLGKKGDNINFQQSKNNIDDWESLLNELKNLTNIEYSEKIYIEGSVFEVAADEIIIIKRNEKRLWTRSCARFDAESSIIKAVNLSIKQ